MALQTKMVLKIYGERGSDESKGKGKKMRVI